MKARTALLAVAIAAAVPTTALGSGTIIDEGRFTGGGHTEGWSNKVEVKVTHGFQLRCDETDHRQNLQVNWEGNRFHLEDVENIECHDSYRDEGMPVAGFDLLKGTGTGRYNGVKGAYIDWKVTDDGEPGGGVDEFRVEIWTSKAKTKKVLRVYSGTLLTKGNHQAHRVTGN
jgi:hypothetical protein